MPGAAAQTRVVSMAGIRLGSWESARAFKGIICADVSEFESHMSSHAVCLCGPASTASLEPTLRLSAQAAHSDQARIQESEMDYGDIRDQPLPARILGRPRIQLVRREDASVRPLFPPQLPTARAPIITSGYDFRTGHGETGQASMTRGRPMGASEQPSHLKGR